jgi:hypothetical protein
MTGVPSGSIPPATAFTRAARPHLSPRLTVRNGPYQHQGPARADEREHQGDEHL